MVHFKHRFAPHFFLLLLVLYGSVGMVAAAEPDPADDRARPILANHYFTETPTIPSPFVRSYVRNRLGLGGVTDFTILPQEINGQPVEGLTGSVTFALLDFEFQYAIREWIALRAKFTLAGRVGTDVQALLAEGVTMTSGFELGWLVGLREGEKTTLGLDLGLSDRSYTGVNIGRFVEDIIEGVDTSLVDKSPSMRGFGGLRWAWAASRLMGMSARVVGGYGESLDRRKSSEVFANAGVALDFDVGVVSTIPMGIALAYSYDSFPEFSSDAAEGIHAVTLRLAYVGRQDFLLSLDLGWEEYPQPDSDETIKGTTTLISMRYYF